ncbi:MAG TPA: M20/M25/M40 family metallo-hydrolase [Thermoleophilaceae bacterium]|nr:M20/M25/M40 family metallo-hydrolase [Thermoleophilaceae bacterium]
MSALEERALRALDPEPLLADACSLVQTPSITGDERAVVERFGRLARTRGLVVQTHVHDLTALRSDPGYPGEEAARSELFGATAVLRGRDRDAPRLCLNGHLDVVDPGSEQWQRDPWSGALADGRLHGRGSLDMKGAVAAGLHALVAVAAAGGTEGDVVLQAVASEEDGGLGTFAALRDDAAFAACLIPEPTAFAVACAQAGALTFTGEIPGVSAHAAARLEGVSAIDRYMPVHAALADLERELNTDVANALMRALELPYPVSVGRIEGGLWSSSVPDRLVFEGRVGVPVGERPEAVRTRLEEVVRAACPEASVTWSGGRFGPGETPVDHAFTQLVIGAGSDELGRPVGAVGVPYGADMRLFCERGIPCVMFGTPGLERAHAVDEYVEAGDLVTLARALIRVISRF